jgi:HmuY protein
MPIVVAGVAWSGQASALSFVRAMRSTAGLLVAPLALLAALSVSGCHYYFEEDDEPDDDGTADDGADSDDGADDGGGVDGGPGAVDAGGPCDPAAILPEGWRPVAEVSTGTVENTPDPKLADVFTTVVDASAGGAAGQAEQPFVYLDLEAEGGAAPVAIDDVASFTSSDWDIALKRFVIRSNSGDSGPADAEVASVSSEELTFDDDVPSELFSDDDWSNGNMADCALVRDSTGGPRTRFSNWYEVAAGRFEPQPVVHLVRLGGGRYAEIDVTTYYGDEANPNRSGIYILRWRRFAP